jgi:hypothetical protein
MAKYADFIGGIFLILFMIGWTNVLGEKLNWWYLIYWLGQ